MFDHIPLVLAQDTKAPTAKQSAGAGKGDAATKQGASSTPGQPVGKQAGKSQGSPFGNSFIFIMLGLMVLMILMTSSGSRKEKRRRKEMLSALRKGDKIETVGGIIGSIIEVTDQHLVVKVDENNNTRLKFGRGAIKTVLQGKDVEEQS